MLPFKTQYHFNGTEITVSTDDPQLRARASGQHWIPCEHIKPLLAMLLSKGAQIDAVETGWSKAELVVTMNKGFASSTAQEFAKDYSLLFYENNDTHYLVAYGCFCEECRQGVEWPQGKLL
jgi:hypothetical protein